MCLRLRMSSCGCVQTARRFMYMPASGTLPKVRRNCTWQRFGACQIDRAPPVTQCWHARHPDTWLGKHKHPDSNIPLCDSKSVWIHHKNISSIQDLGCIALRAAQDCCPCAYIACLQRVKSYDFKVLKWLLRALICRTSSTAQVYQT